MPALNDVIHIKIFDLVEGYLISPVKKVKLRFKLLNSSYNGNNDPERRECGYSDKPYTGCSFAGNRTMVLTHRSFLCYWSYNIKQGCQVQKNFKRPNFAISSFKKAKSSKMKKGQIKLKWHDSKLEFLLIIFFMANRFKKGQIWMICPIKRPNGNHDT
jgi:hypothetical protein